MYFLFKSGDCFYDVYKNQVLFLSSLVCKYEALVWNFIENVVLVIVIEKHSYKYGIMLLGTLTFHCSSVWG